VVPNLAAKVALEKHISLAKKREHLMGNFLRWGALGELLLADAVVDMKLGVVTTTGAFHCGECPNRITPGGRPHLGLERRKLAGRELRDKKTLAAPILNKTAIKELD
jgi:hypothetical protein